MTPGDERPTIREPKALRALAHPLRWSLLEVLHAEDAATATRCADLLHEPVNSCSYHLRILAKYGFVVAVPGLDGKERPWRLVPSSVSWAAGDDEESPTAVDGLDDMLIDREAQRQHAFVRDRASYPPEWQQVAQAEAAIRWMTPAETRALNQDLAALLGRHRDRSDASTRPVGAHLVRITAITVPLPGSDGR